MAVVDAGVNTGAQGGRCGRRAGAGQRRGGRVAAVDAAGIPGTWPVRAAAAKMVEEALRGFEVGPGPGSSQAAAGSFDPRLAAPLGLQGSRP